MCKTTCNSKSHLSSGSVLYYALNEVLFKEKHVFAALLVVTWPVFMPDYMGNELRDTQVGWLMPAFIQHGDISHLVHTHSMPGTWPASSQYIFTTNNMM